ncbi:MAG: VapC toxin family PIN domain ribonuclease [Gammaproteobacteria bacterium]|nr:MAG: VapC toxin family PIN domain ribonuclease [Gammaproteobacteria bacterium]
MYLLDTNVISELRKVGDGKADKNVALWVSKQDILQCYLSAITVMEVEIGALRIARKDKKQGTVLLKWLEEMVLPQFSERILPIDTRVARCCARFHVPNPCSERDALLSATAFCHGMTVVTRNVRDFEATGVALINPWETTAI